MGSLMLWQRQPHLFTSHQVFFFFFSKFHNVFAQLIMIEIPRLCYSKKRLLSFKNFEEQMCN